MFLLPFLMLPLLLLLLCVGIQQGVAGEVVIDGGSDGGFFEYDVGVARNIRRVVDMAWLPDGRVLVAGKEGDIYIFDDGDLEGDREVIYNVDPCIQQERALLSITVHPKFGTKNDGRFDYVYAFWVHKGRNGNCIIIEDFGDVNTNGPYCQLSRFRLTASNKLRNEEVLLKTGNAGKMHNGGGMGFGPDGYLYLATGDTGYPRRFDPANKLDNLWGKILRIKDDGIIPPDNPYVGEKKSQPCGKTSINPGDGTSRVCTEIFARGLRNPFSLEMNPNVKGGKVEFHVSDVGRENWEEINVGGTGYEKADYGWREREGPCEMGETNRDKCGKIDSSKFVDPIYFYQHGRAGAACVGGAFIPNGVWPKKYDNEYLYSDLRSQSVFHLKRDDDNECRGKTCDKQKPKYVAVPIVKNVEGSSVLRLRFGPHSKKRSGQASLYHLLYDKGKINRLTYVKQDGGANDDSNVDNNRKPVAVIETFYSSDSKGVTVRFDGSKSSDPDKDKLRFKWDFGEDGKNDSDDDIAITSHTYKTPGRFFASLKVSDGNGKSSETSVTIYVDEDYDRSSDSDYGIPTLPTFPWKRNCDSYNENSGNIDRCGILEFCFDEDSEIYGYQTGEGRCGPLTMGSAPVIRLQPGFTYRLTLRNFASDPTNIHTHGLHIVGSGDGDDVTRVVDGGGSCIDYIWDLRSDHPGGTYWYHPHAHSFSETQVNGGATGLLIVEDNENNNDDIPYWASNELLLQILRLDDGSRMLSNGRAYEIFNLIAGKWYRLRVSIVDALGVSHELQFTSGCELHKVASDGIWHSVVPFDEGSTNSFEMTGSSRGDFAVRCNASPAINILFGDKIAAIVNIKPDSSSSLRRALGKWKPKRPSSMRNMKSIDVPERNRLAIKIKRDSINDKEWDASVPLKVLAFDEVHEWELPDTRQHPFHIHLYHMQVVTPNGCGNGYLEGQFYDTISSGPCTVRFRTSDFGQRLVVHCHVMLHSDLGSMGWFDVRGEGMPIYELSSPRHDCSGNAVPSPTVSPALTYKDSAENCKIFDELPFTAGANQFCSYSDTTLGNDAEDKTCGMGPVDAKITNGSSTCDRDCFIGFTVSGEYVTYNFLTDSTVDNIMIKARVASKVDKKKRFRLKLLDEKMESDVLFAPGKGYDVYEEVTWELTGLSEGLHQLRIEFVDDNVNLCTITVETRDFPRPGPTVAPASRPKSRPDAQSNDEIISNDEPTTTSIQSPPITWAALDYYQAFEKTPEISQGDGCNIRGDGVDAKLTEDSTCILRDGAQCNIGWWDPGEYLLYRFLIGPGSSGSYDIRVRVASKQDGKNIEMILLSTDGSTIKQSERLDVPANGWDKFNDVIWRSVNLEADEYSLKILSTTGYLNLCSASITSTDYEIEVPGYYNAMYYANAGNFDTTQERLGDCPYRENTPIDAKINDDLICMEAISEYDLHCNVAFTEENESVVYKFRKLAAQTKVSISLRVASKTARNIFVELSSLDTKNYGTYSLRFTKVVSSSGNASKSWDIYETLVVWDEIDIGMEERYKLTIEFLDGRVNLCAIGIYHVSEMLLG